MRIGLAAIVMLLIVACSSSSATRRSPATLPPPTPDFAATVAVVGEDAILEDLFWRAAVAAGSNRDSSFAEARTTIRIALDADLKSRVSELGALGSADPFRDWPQCFSLATAIQSIILLEEAPTPLEAAPHVGLALEVLPALYDPAALR